MALNYDQAGSLQTNLAFGIRVKVACMKLANYIEDEASSVQAHNARLRWATQIYQSPDAVARQIQAIVVWEPLIQQADIDQPDGDSTASDDDVQSSVEAVANRLF